MRKPVVASNANKVEYMIGLNERRGLSLLAARMRFLICSSVKMWGMYLCGRPPNASPGGISCRSSSARMASANRRIVNNLPLLVRADGPRAAQSRTVFE